MLSKLIAGTLLLLIAAWVSSARADEASEAQLHFEIGSELYHQRRYPEALDHFLASNRLVPNRNVVFDIASVYRLMRRYDEAFNWLETYVRDFALSDEERARGLHQQELLLGSVALVDVQTEPPGAILHIDRVDLGARGASPRRIAVPRGVHRVIATHPLRREAQAEVQVEPGAATPVRLTLDARVGGLHIDSSPIGATVQRDDDQPLGVTPLDLELPVGSYRLTFQRSEHGTITRDVQVRDGERTSLSVTLAPLPRPRALLSAEANATDAEVRVDRVSIGTAPLSIGDVLPGTHDVEIRAAGHDPWRGPVLFEPGGATRLRVTLRDRNANAPEWIAILGYVLGGASTVAAIVCAGASVAARDAFFGSENPTRAEHDRVGALALSADVLGSIGGAVLLATLIWDLATGDAPPSTAQITIDR